MAKNKTAGKHLASKSKVRALIKKGKPSAGGIKTVSQVERRKIRWRPGTVTLREIKKYQKSTSNLCPRAPF